VRHAQGRCAEMISDSVIDDPLMVELRPDAASSPVDGGLIVTVHRFRAVTGRSPPCCRGWRSYVQPAATATDGGVAAPRPHRIWHAAMSGLVDGGVCAAQAPAAATSIAAQVRWGSRAGRLRGL
jgi:hypothetical protein